MCTSLMLLQNFLNLRGDNRSNSNDVSMIHVLLPVIRSSNHEKTADRKGGVESGQQSEVKSHISEAFFELVSMRFFVDSLRMDGWI